MTPYEMGQWSTLKRLGMLKAADEALQLDFLDTIPRLSPTRGVLPGLGEKTATWRFDKTGGMFGWLKNVFTRGARLRRAPSARAIGEAEDMFSGAAKTAPDPPSSATIGRAEDAFSGNPRPSPSRATIGEAEAAFAGRSRRAPNYGEAERHFAGKAKPTPTQQPAPTQQQAAPPAGGEAPAAGAPGEKKPMSPAMKWGLGAGAGGLAAGYYLGSPSAPAQPPQQMYGQPGMPPGMPGGY